jgi:exonuclease SbcD
MLKLIHTSDWHLGQNFYGYDRSEEQKDFLDQLTAIVRKHTPDALLVSGDIFQTPAPSNAAVNLYVNAMLDIHEACPSMAIVVIAGNHDSASRLDSDKRLWQLANVRVLGGIARDNEGKADLGSHIIKIDGKGVVAAVPFAYPASFPMPPGVDELERSERQPAYFQTLLNHANAQAQDALPVVLMAHLAISNSDFVGHDRDMKMECVDLATLGTGYDYVALGHIHRPQDVSERVRYCGTPVPVSFDEQCEHSVSIVEIDSHGALPRVETKVIKNYKPLHTIPANEPVDFETALQQLLALNPNERSYIRLNVKVDQFLPTGAQEQAARAVKDKQCRFCEIKKTATLPIARTTAVMTIEEFNRKTPLDIANQYFTNKYGQPMDAQLQEMFNSVYESVKDENRK